MYVPPQFQLEDKSEAIAFMRRFSFGLIITAKNGFPVATHLPVVIREENDKIVLASHYAKANSQWEEIPSGKTLVVFNEPHAYISPKYYEKKLNVPTWNYLAVHAYGNGYILKKDEDALRILESMIDNYDAAYKNQWNGLPMEYKLKMIKGIVAFEIQVSELIGKKKLSQNKTENERNTIISAFENSESENVREIAEFMKRL